EFIAETGTPANSNTYGYDALDRLTSAVTPTTSYGYGYDAVGNRTSKTVGAGSDTYAYSPTSNRIASITPSSGPVRSFIFDANGSTTDDANNTYSYDVRGRMVSATSSVGTTTYQVNALGQRVRKTNSSSDTVFTYDSRGHLIAESTAVGALIREYVWLGDMPLAISNASGTYFVHVDHLNTPRLVADATGTTVWRLDQAEPFGNNPADEDPSGLGAFELPLRLPGQYLDKETNLHYNYFRDYDASIGRYGESDRIDLRGGLNTYAYVGGNPLSWRDTFGLRIDWGDFVLNNPLVRSNFEALNTAIGAMGIPDDCFVLRVTGGDRYRDPKNPKVIRSATNNQIVKNASQTSPHLIEHGARAVDFTLDNSTDICTCKKPVTNGMVDDALRSTDFAPANTARDYPDNPHTHIALPPLQRFMYRP
ncbi:MAG: RHS repeat domain-containing protein, partial [Bryobacteraceae bacterium]